MRRWPIGLVVWLLLLAAAETAGFGAVWRFFVQSEHGQLLDTIALTGNQIGQSRIEELVKTILNTMSVVSLAVATAVIGFIGLARRRVAVAFGAILLIVGANVTTQVAKVVIDRPEVGADPERVGVGNSLPSGHATIAASVAVALLLVLPVAVRAIGALIGAVFTAVAAVATLSAGWHRPSDAVAALLVVGAWACAAQIVIVVAQRRHGDVEYGPPDRVMTGLLAAGGLLLLAGAGTAMWLTDGVLDVPLDDLGRRALFVAYAGGAMGIAGGTAVLVASVLATIHRVVPKVVAVHEEPVHQEPVPGTTGVPATEATVPLYIDAQQA